LGDTRGFLQHLVVSPADVSDAAGARAVRGAVAGRLPRWRLVGVDQAYRGVVAWAREHRDLDLEVVERPPGHTGFLLLAHRWIVERSFAWLGRSRRLSNDYAYHLHTSESMGSLASIHFLLRRITTPTTPSLRAL